MKGLKYGLSKETAKILEGAGFDTREKVIAAGDVSWLKLPRFGSSRMAEVNEWLGDDAPTVKREIDRCVKFLEARGFTVMKPN